MNAPCKDCKDRSRACHDICERYKEWITTERSKKQKMQQEMGLSECDFFHISNVVKTKRRYNL